MIWASRELMPPGLVEEERRESDGWGREEEVEGGRREG